jgi:iron transport multicopper oxidase
VLTFSDWYHDSMDNLVAQFMNKANPTGAEPIPDSAIMNDTTGLKFGVQPGKTYLFRMINIGAFAAHHVWIQGHDMTIVEVDGVYTQPATTDLLYIAVAQRYAVLVTAKNDTSTNFPITGAMDQVGDSRHGTRLTIEGPVRQHPGHACKQRHRVARLQSHGAVSRGGLPRRVHGL